MSMNVWRLMIMRLTGVADGAQLAAGRVGRRRSSTRSTHPCSSSRVTVRWPAARLTVSPSRRRKP